MTVKKTRSNRHTTHKSPFGKAHSAYSPYVHWKSIYQQRQRSRFPFDYTFAPPEFYLRPVPIFSKDQELPIYWLYYFVNGWTGQNKLAYPDELDAWDEFHFKIDYWYKLYNYRA
jgi:hypothetical protein